MSQYVRSENYKHDLMAPHTCQLPGAFLAGIDCDFLTISTVVNKWLLSKQITEFVGEKGGGGGK